MTTNDDAEKQLTKNLSSIDSPNVFKFRNMNFVVGSGNEEKHLLKDVSGKVKGGQVLAVMGPSGAGSKYLREWRLFI